VISHDDGRIPLAQHAGQRRSASAKFCHIDVDLQPVQRISGRVGDDLRIDAIDAGKSGDPQIQRGPFLCADCSMVAALPLPECGNGPGNALLANLHASPNANVLKIGGSDQIPLAGDDARGRAA